MHEKTIVLSRFEDVEKFVNCAEKCNFKISLHRDGDISVFDGKSFLNVAILLGWNIHVRYDGNDTVFEEMLMKYRVTSLNMGWNDYAMKQLFNETLCTGLTEIDNQHKLLGDHFNYFADACEHGNIQQIRTIFEFLETFVWDHFNSEIRFLEKHNFPEIELHKKEHVQLKNKINELKSKIEETNTEYIATYIYDVLFPAGSVKYYV